MDDKQLSELMQDYLNSRLKGDKEKDLSKFNQIGFKRKPSIFKSKIFFATLSCVIIFIFCISITLPLILNGRKGGKDIRYYDDTEIVYIENVTNEQLYVHFNVDVLIPDIFGIDYENKYIYTKEENLFIGIKSDVYVYDENFDLIKLFVLNKNNKLSFLEQQILENNTQWQETSVKWNIVQSDEIFIYTFSFEKGDYYYFYKIESINQFEISNLLDAIF